MTKRIGRPKRADGHGYHMIGIYCTDEELESIKEQQPRQRAEAMLNAENLQRGLEFSSVILEAASGKTIAGMSIDPEYNDEDGGLVVDFTDGSGIVLFDDGRSCCENRYIHTDDDLAAFIGAMFLGAETRDAPNVPDEWGDHEVQFLFVNTSLGTCTLETHNEHNGYYGGFYMKVAEK